MGARMTGPFSIPFTVLGVLIFPDQKTVFVLFAFVALAVCSYRIWLNEYQRQLPRVSCRFDPSIPGCVRTVHDRPFAVFSLGQSSAPPPSTETKFYRIEVRANGARIERCRGALVEVLRGDDVVASGESIPLAFATFSGSIGEEASIEDGVPAYLNVIQVVEGDFPAIVAKGWPKSMGHPSDIFAEAGDYRLRVIISTDAGGPSIEIAPVFRWGGESEASAMLPASGSTLTRQSGGVAM